MTKTVLPVEHIDLMVAALLHVGVVDRGLANWAGATLIRDLPGPVDAGRHYAWRDHEVLLSYAEVGDLYRTYLAANPQPGWSVDTARDLLRRLEWSGDAVAPGRVWDADAVDSYHAEAVRRS